MPDPTPLSLFTNVIASAIQDNSNWVTGDIPSFLQQALLSRYSVDRPLIVISDIAGNGTSFVPLPACAINQDGTTMYGAYVPVFDPSFSIIKSIEYPIGDTPSDDADPRDWSVYNTPAGYQLQLIACTPGPNEQVRIGWTAQHATDGSTVAKVDFYPVANFTASLCLEAMAAKAIQYGDSTMGADVVNYRTKSQEYLTLAKAKRKAYFNHMGIDENDTSVEMGPAIALGDMKNVMASGVDRMTHSRNTR